MKAKLLSVSRNMTPVQVEDFPKSCPRSCKGSLHFRPGGTATVTEGELKHIKKTRPELASKLRVIYDTQIAGVDKPVEPKASKAPTSESSRKPDGFSSEVLSATGGKPDKKSGKGRASKTG